MKKHLVYRLDQDNQLKRIKLFFTRHCKESNITFLGQTQVGAKRRFLKLFGLMSYVTTTGMVNGTFNL